MIYYCPIQTSLKLDEFTHYRLIIGKAFPEIRTMGALGCKAWGEVMLSYYAEQGVKPAVWALNELMNYDDDDLEVMYVLKQLSEGGTEEMLVAIEVARSLQPEKKIDRRLRPALSDEFNVLPDSTPSLNLNDLTSKMSLTSLTKTKKTINSIL